MEKVGIWNRETTGRLLMVNKSAMILMKGLHSGLVVSVLEHQRTFQEISSRWKIYFSGSLHVCLWSTPICDENTDCRLLVGGQMVRKRGQPPAYFTHLCLEKYSH